jgi:hypothetical protein
MLRTVGFATLILLVSLSTFGQSGKPGSQERFYHEHTKYIDEWERRAPYPIKRSGYHALIGSVPIPLHLVWLDNDQILFPGIEASSMKFHGKDNDFELRRAGAPLTAAPLFVWNIRTNEVKRHGETNSDVCHLNKNVIFWKHVTEREIARFEGLPGREMEVVGSTKDVGIRQLLASNWLNQFTCNVPEMSFDGRTPKGHRLIPLRPEHGYLDRGTHHFTQRPASEKRFQVKLYRRGMSDGLPLVYEQFGKMLPLEDEDIASDPYGRYTQYAEFLDVYVLNGREIFFGPGGTKAFRARDWYKRFPSYVFQLKPSGELLRIDIPVEMAKFNIISYYLTRRGVFGFSHGPNASGFGKTDAKAGYGVLLEGKHAKKVLLGNIRGVGISPDGCKVAAAIERGAPLAKPIEIKLLDVCPEGTGEHSQ